MHVTLRRCFSIIKDCVLNLGERCMIPKIIHYCWFGHGEKPDSVRHFIAGWRLKLPDYEIKEWNEDNFDVASIPYAREAYEARRYAFVADCARLYALATEGGIYLDTDVEVLKSFDPYLGAPAFLGYESEVGLCTAVMGSEPGGKLVCQLLDDYRERHFINGDGTLNTTVNVVYVTNRLKQFGWIVDGRQMEVKDVAWVYPQEYFSPKSLTTGKIKITPNTVTIHHLNASWYNTREKMVYWIGKRCGRGAAQVMSLLCHNPLYICQRAVRYVKTGQ